ncbi:hypothetical protein GCM10027291_42590 [Telluribacter humicola]
MLTVFFKTVCPNAAKTSRLTTALTDFRASSLFFIKNMAFDLNSVCGYDRYKES